MIDNKDYKKRDYIIFGIIFIISLAIRFITSDFPKTIHSYPDELRYYGLARSLFFGRGLSLYNVSSDYQKIGYSLLLAPFFIIKNGFLRTKSITFFNCLLMNSALFPAVLLGKELNLKKSQNIFFVCLCLLWPDMTFSMTFMSEVLYWPLVLLFVWLWLVNVRLNKHWVTIVLGAICYIGYLCKEIFLVLFLANIVFALVYPFINSIIEKQGFSIASCFDKKRFLSIGIFIFVFFGFHGLLKLTVFSGLGNSYDQMGIGAIKNIYNLCYMVQSFFIYLSASLLAILVFPVVYPLLYIRKLSKNAQQLFIFIVIAILGTAATVAYTISVREDLGLLVPAIHLRYVSPMIVVCIAIFLTLSEAEIIDKSNFKYTCSIFIIFIGFIAFTFKGGHNGIGSWTALAWYKVFQKLFPVINKGNEFVLYPYAVVVAVALSITAFILHFIKEKKGNALFFNLFSILCVAFLFVDNVVSIKLVREPYCSDKKIIQDVLDIDDYMAANAGSQNILYISAGDSASENEYFHTYYNYIKNTYVINENEILTGNCNIDNMAYIIMPSTLSLECINGEPVGNLGGRHFSVVKNSNRNISILQKSNRKVSFDWNICLTNGFDKDGSRFLNPNGNMYGPYWHIEKGNYMIKIQGENLKDVDVKLYSEKGAVSYPYESDIEENLVILSFSLDNDVDNFEINVKNTSRKNLKMDSLELVSVD